MRDVNPFEELLISFMIGTAELGCVNPSMVKLVWLILKLAFPVTEIILKKKKLDVIT